MSEEQVVPSHPVLQEQFPWILSQDKVFWVSQLQFVAQPTPYLPSSQSEIYKYIDQFLESIIYHIYVYVLCPFGLLNMAHIFPLTDVLFINVAYQCMFFDRHLIFFPQHKCMCTQSQAHSGHMFHYMDLGCIHQYLKSIKYIHVKRITFGQRVRFFKIALNFVFYLRKRNRRTLFFNVIQNKCSIKMFQHTATISDLY